jgi:hypothetical protein
MFILWRGSICHAPWKVSAKQSHLFLQALLQCLHPWYVNLVCIWGKCRSHFERPFLFKLAKVCEEDDPSKKALQTAYTPCLLPTNISSRRSQPYSYEIYHPLVSAHQFGFGQLPIHLFFVNWIQPREILESSLQYSRLKALTNILTVTDLSEWTPAHFCSDQYKTWWSDWKFHLWSQPASQYCLMIDPGQTFTSKKVPLSLSLS